MSASPRALLVALSTLSIPGATLAAQHAMPAAHSASAATSAITPKAAGYYSFGFRPGERVADVSVTDVDGKKVTLAGLAGSTGAVIVIRDAECPVTQRYSPRLAELEKEFGP
ncbi:MAG: hypothetical protein ABI969_01365, partial [bacterium]